MWEYVVIPTLPLMKNYNNSVSVVYFPDIRHRKIHMYNLERLLGYLKTKLCHFFIWIFKIFSIFHGALLVIHKYDRLNLTFINMIG